MMLKKSPDHEFDRELRTVVIPKLHEWGTQRRLPLCLSVCLSPLNRHEAPLASCTSKAEREQNRWDIRGNYAQPIHLSILQSARARESRFLSTRLKKSVMNEIDTALTLEA